VRSWTNWPGGSWLEFSQDIYADWPTVDSTPIFGTINWAIVNDGAVYSSLLIE
jgi:hypothetical protein